ncbi:MAG: ATP-binding protein, partial [Candidatus Omnitrophota bacterium]|nr:ATP-binding protein [Candidatus Omnitrophota bacterium]
QAASGLLGYQEDELIGKPATIIFAEEDEEAILNRADVPAMLISKDFKILKVNAAFIRLMGVSREDIIDEFCYKVTHKRESMCTLPHDICPAKEAMEKNKPCVQLHTYFDKQGNPFLVNVVVAPVPDSSGKFLYYLHLTKELEDDREKHLSRQEALAIAGKLADQLKGALKDVSGKLDEAHVFTKTGLHKLIEAGAVSDVEMNYKSKFGEKIPVSFSGSVMKDKTGRLIGIVGVAKDMREIKRLMHQEKETAIAKAEANVERKKAKELEGAYKQLKELQDTLIQAEKLNAIGQLASGVAHEVKNPLGIIMQSVEYLEGKLLPSEKNAPEALRIIKDNIKRADNIIRVLLDFSRVSKLEKKPEDINSILENSLVLIQHRTVLENIKITRELGKGLPDILVDKSKLEQVFINIFLNALEVMPEGGSLLLRTYQAKLSKLKKGVGAREEDYFRLGENVLMVEIEDTGAGISPENLKKIFDPFFTTKDSGKGTGLGLSVTRNILIMHKGLIEIESQPGRGTKVIITLKISDGGKNG